MERWFSAEFRATPQLDLWRNMLIRQPREGYIGCSAAIAGSDFLAPTSGLRLPCLGIAGSEDGSTPPDLVRETINLIPGAQFHILEADSTQTPSPEHADIMLTCPLNVIPGRQQDELIL